MRILYLIFIVFLVIGLSGPPVAAEKAQTTEYVATHDQVRIACGPETHPLLPTEEPDPQDPSTLFSGEPECVFGDGQNAVREAQGGERSWHGLGAARHLFDGGDDGSIARANTDDATFGLGASFLQVSASDWATGDQVAAEGCGPQQITLPAGPRTHWEEEPPTYWWAFIPAVGVTDDLQVCFASTGVMHASWGYES